MHPTRSHAAIWLTILTSCIFLLGSATPKPITAKVVNTAGRAIPDADVHVISGHSSFNFDISEKSGPEKFKEPLINFGRSRLWSEMPRFQAQDTSA